jgi:hypothetical protein
VRAHRDVSSKFGSAISGVCFDARVNGIINRRIGRPHPACQNRLVASGEPQIRYSLVSVFGNRFDIQKLLYAGLEPAVGDIEGCIIAGQVDF